MEEMTMTTEAEPVYIPLLNPNEPEAHLASLDVREGQHVEIGQVLCTLETTKSTTEVVAESAGYFVQIQFRQGQKVQAGELLGYLADSPEWVPARDTVAPPEPVGEQSPQIPAGLRITQPAVSLAQEMNLDLNKLPIGPLITADSLREFFPDSPTRMIVKEVRSEFDSTSILIYGGGGHGKKLIDLIRLLGGYRLAGIVDDGLPPVRKDGSSNSVMGVPVLGGQEVLPELYTKGLRLAANGIGGIGNPSLRVKVYERLAENGYTFPTLVHPTAYVEPSAKLSPGVQIFPLAYVGSEASVGFGVILNNSVVISHDCIIEGYANISPGAMIAGNVEIGELALIGMGVTINLGVKLGRGARVGNGATVKAAVPEDGVVRAGAVWPD
jgi:acetyltransferase EpsM